MSSLAPNLATYADLMALPEDVRAEVIAGAVVTSPAPLPRHSYVHVAASRFIGGPFQDDDARGGPGDWWCFLGVDLQLGVHDIVRPDIAGWRKERLPRPGGVRPIDVVPDWISEVLSPATASRDRVHKRNLYARSGVPYYWLIDPVARVLEALKLDNGVWVELGVHDDQSVARIAPFDAIELEVGRLFLPREADDIAEE